MKTILAATDFTAASWNALRFAADMAIDFKTELIVLHATHIPVVSDVYFDLRKSMEDWKQEDELEMAKVLDKLQKKYGPDLKVKSLLKIGYGADVIRDMVKRGGIGLVVMGIAQTEKFNEIVFGSTSTDVAGTVSCPVLIVPENATYKQWKSIAFAFDQKHIPMGKGIQTLKEILLAHQSKLNFVNVMDTPFIEGDDSSLKPIMKELKGVELKTHFLPYHTNMMEEAIQDWVRRHKASMLVTVARKHNVLWRMFNERSTKKLAFSSKVPVLVLSDMK
ncbi:MAG: universal stress protein [Flavobacteriales bacterium]|jgi:nucleotide-binding universal stress UspA family protein